MSWSRSSSGGFSSKNSFSFTTQPQIAESLELQVRNIAQMDKQWHKEQKEKKDKKESEDVPVKEDAEATVETEIVVKQKPLIEVLKTVDSAESKTEYPEETFTEQLY